MMWDGKEAVELPVKIRDCISGGEIYARKGEVSCCRIGHPIARFVRDVMAGQKSNPDDCEFIHPAAKPGITKCPTCWSEIASGTDDSNFYWIAT